MPEDGKEPLMMYPAELEWLKKELGEDQLERWARSMGFNGYAVMPLSLPREPKR